MTQVEDLVRDHATFRPSQEDLPGFLRVRDSRGLLPEMVPPWEFLAKVARIDRRWRVEWDRVNGRYVLFHDHENYPKEYLRVCSGQDGPYTKGTPTMCVTGKDGQYMPLDGRTLRQIEMGAWLERHAHSPEEYDALVARVLEEVRADRAERAAIERRYWLRENFPRIKRAMDDNVFHLPHKEAAKPLYFH